jgi:catechol 2,3-dioxygenase-like lactoylglutathione lyase family enzyme
MRQKLNLITFGVENFEKAVNFYEKGLGWKKSSASVEELALFPLGGMVLALHPRKALAEDAMVNSAGSGFAGLTISFNAKSEQEVDEVMHLVETLGAEIVKPPKKFFGVVTADTLKISMDTYSKWHTIRSGRWMKMTTSNYQIKNSINSKI